MSIEAAIAEVSKHLAPVAAERVPFEHSLGRVLAEPIVADRDSPPLDVSAMDGYALRLADFIDAPLDVVGTACAGHPLVSWTRGTAVQIFTGAPVPQGLDCVVRREDTDESPGRVTVKVPSGSLKPGQNIRRRGENAKAGDVIVPAGTQIDAATIGSLASFCQGDVSVGRLLKIAVLTSGDELIPPGNPVEPWQIRDSNSGTLRAWLAGLPWTRLVCHHRVADSLDAVQHSLVSALKSSDVVILTGGVSAGDTDCVPDAIESLGGQILFHRLPIRPGQPVLAARLNGKLIIGLPGNPVSVAVTSRVLAEPLMERMVARSSKEQLRYTLAEPDDKTLKLTWFRLIQIRDGVMRLVDSRGSGDVVSIARSHGFIEVPPQQSGPGPWRTWLW